MTKLFRLLMIPSLLCVFALSQSTEKVLWSFGGASMNDGSAPLGELVMDASGNLYGTTSGGGSISNCPGGCGTVFELSPSSVGGWTETIIYDFCSVGSDCEDGAFPYAGLVFDEKGNLYGTTYAGGNDGGTVFELSPPSRGSDPWTETVLYSFCSAGENCPDGGSPYSKLTFDASGNLYGTTAGGGSGNGGTVFELSPGANGWTESVLYNFCSVGSYPHCVDGLAPEAGVTFDSSGSLYGTTLAGGSSRYLGGGLVYKLSPGSQGWTKSNVYVFNQPNYKNGAGLYGEVNFDKNGNIYSTAAGGGQYGAGGAFRLSSRAPLEYTLSFNYQVGAYEPHAGVLIDEANNTFYGTNSTGGAGNAGDVFKIAGKTVTSLYTFTGGADGGSPMAALTADKAGNLYGTTKSGGANNLGVVFEIVK